VDWLQLNGQVGHILVSRGQILGVFFFGVGDGNDGERFDFLTIDLRKFDALVVNHKVKCIY